MTLFQTIIIAIIQGLTELFPISSVAHAVITPWAFGWPLDPTFLKEHFLPFVVMLHLGTAVALLGFFGRDWVVFTRCLVDRGEVTARRELLRVIIATIPAAVLGLLFEKQLKAIFSSVESAALFLIVNGVVLYVGEKLRGRGEKRLADIGYVDALLVGLAQSSALVPGFSRSGTSMVAGFLVGLGHEAAARFSMLLATPIIIGASILEIRHLHAAGTELFGYGLIGGVVGGLCALVSVWALMRWFKRNEVDAMWPFAFYCWGVGGLVLAIHWF